MSDELPPANLILQALHAIKGSVDKTNDRLERLETSLGARIDATNMRLDKTNERLDHLETSLNQRIDETNARLENLRKFTVQGLTDLNHKVDEGFEKVWKAIDKQSGEIHELNARFDHFLTGEGARMNKRMDSLEQEVRRLASKVDH